MKWHLNDWPDWDEYYHEDNISSQEFRYIRQTRDGQWWYVFEPPRCISEEWIPLPEVSSLKEAAEVVEVLWRMR